MTIDRAVLRRQVLWLLHHAPWAVAAAVFSVLLNHTHVRWVWCVESAVVAYVFAAVVLAVVDVALTALRRRRAERRDERRIIASIERRQVAMDAYRARHARPARFPRLVHELLVVTEWLGLTGR